MMRYGVRALFIFCAVLVLALAGTGGYYAYLNANPHILAALIQEKIEQRLGTEVSVEGARASLGLPPHLLLTNVNIGSPENPYVSTEQLKAWISLRHLLFGNISLTRIKFLRPVANLRWNDFQAPAAAGDFDIPHIDVEGGTAILHFDAQAFTFKEVEGSIDTKSARFHLKTMEGMAAMEINRNIASVEGALHLRGISLAAIDSRMAGTVDLHSEFKFGVLETRVAVAAQARKMKLPWFRKAVDTMNASISAQGEKSELTIDRIAVQTEFAELEGKGMLSGIGGAGGLSGSVLDIGLHSSEFGYEKAVDLLPLKYFPDWLSILLSRQIRGGSVSLSRIACRGTLKELFTAGGFAKGLTIAGNLNGQTFQAGHDSSRVETIAGECRYSAGDLSFLTLSGTAGASKIESVDLIFHDIGDKDFRLSVSVDLDMAAADFCTAWRAVMVPRELYDLLSPVSSVKKGRIEGSADIHTDSSQPVPTQLKGRAALADCTLQWSGQFLKGINARAKKPAFEDPLEIEAGGYLNEYRIDKLNLSFPELLKNAVYRLEAATGLPQPAESVPFGLGEGAAVSFSGNGDGPRIQGGFNILAQEVSLFGMRFRPKEGRIEGAGTASAVLWPESALTIGDCTVAMAPGKLEIQASADKAGGGCEIEGTLDMACLEISGGDFLPVRGFVDGDLRVSWKDGVSAEGLFTCRKTSLSFNGESIEFDGSIKMKGNMLSSPGISIGIGGATARLSGDFVIAEPLLFKGNAEIDGLTIAKEKTGAGVPMPGGIFAEAAVSLTRASIYGLPIDRASARLVADADAMRLFDIRADLLSGSVTGTAIIKKSGKTEIDVMIETEKLDLEPFIAAIYPESQRMDGIATVKGRLWGPVDAINGDLSFAAAEGHIKKYSLLSKIFAVLNPYKIFKSGELDLAGEGFSYNTITADFTIRDGIVQFDNFFFDSDSLQASSVGSYAIKEKQIDAAVIVEPLETVDKILGLIPLVGWILTGEKNRFIVVSLTVKGDIENPSIVFAPIDTISEPVTGILLRILKLPVDVIRNFKKMIPSLIDK